MYFIQAENQLAGVRCDYSVWEVPMGPTLVEYLRENLPTGGTLAFDGQVVDLARGQDYADMLASKQGRILWDHDLAGSLWRERPSRSSEPVYILEKNIPGRVVRRSWKNFGNI